jgi:hypothetical protein
MALRLRFGCVARRVEANGQAGWRSEEHASDIVKSSIDNNRRSQAKFAREDHPSNPRERGHLRKYSRNDLITTRDSPAGFLFAIITVSDRGIKQREFKSKTFDVPRRVGDHYRLRIRW